VGGLGSHGTLFINIFLLLFSGKIFKQVKIIHFLMFNNNVMFLKTNGLYDHLAINELEIIFILF